MKLTAHLTAALSGLALPIFAQLPKPSPEEELEALAAGQKIFAAAGVTTAHEGATHLDKLQTLQRGAKAGKLFIDVIAYPFVTEMKQVLRSDPPGSLRKLQQSPETRRHQSYH